MNNKYETFFPKIITNLPKVDINIDGLNAFLFQGNNQQIVFMSFEKDIFVPKHSHEAQWGIVLDGEMRITIDKKEKILKKGDSYFIPREVIHSAKIMAGYKDLTLFNQKDRYSVLQK
jgi:quercetin dioxygenase-like cupin family protein